MEKLSIKIIIQWKAFKLFIRKEGGGIQHFTINYSAFQNCGTQQPVNKRSLKIISTTTLIKFFSLSTVTKFIRIGIADKNDNPPYFDKALYEAEVDENEDIQHTVLTVTAKDHDECKWIVLQLIYV